MDYKRFENTVVLRLDRGDEITSSLLSLAKKEGITSASVSGIGGSDDITLGVWNGAGYDRVHLDTTNEITSIAGNITVMNGEPYQHIHLTCARAGGGVTGGHLISCVISLTAEIFITVLEGKVSRRRDEALGINLLSFEA